MLHTETPALILAGAGSGKTRVLTRKIAYLVSQGLKPWQILAVTFTNKAAREMASRVEKLLDMPAQGLWIGTFHGMCVRILRREADNWGFRRDFTIYDRDDQLVALKKVYKETGLKNERLNQKTILNRIGNAKNDFISPDQIGATISGPDASLIEDCYRRYQKFLKAAGAFDFDDLLVHPVEMFEKYPDTLTHWQNRFKYILIDEYQDTNRTQYLLMKMLAGNSGNITVVGDDDQSIYGWRGADIRNILEFESDFKGVKTFRLEQNYRSSGNILKAANAVAVNNEKRMSKKLWTERPDGEKVAVIECHSDRDEAERVIRSIENEMEELNLTLKDFVILYRTNAQSRLFEDVLRRRAMRYIIIGGLKFYDRKEIKDLLAYLRLIANPDDAVSFGRAITNPKRKIGDKTIELIDRFVSENGVSYIEALKRVSEIFPKGATHTRLTEFYTILESCVALRGKANIGELAETLVESLGYRLYLTNAYPENFEERIANVDELLSAMSEFANPNEEEDDLSTFLSDVALVADVDSMDDSSEALTLMTIHSAKGLEYKSVYTTGVEYGLFPLPYTLDDEAQLAEERRLFYVAITRAEKRLHITYALSRMRHGTFGGGQSMFINEIPEECMTLDKREPVPRVGDLRKNQPIRKSMEFEDYSQDVPDFGEESPFRVGSFVRSPSFGRGKVVASSGSGEDLMLTIEFGKKKMKIMAQYGKLVPA